MVVKVVEVGLEVMEGGSNEDGCSREDGGGGEGGVGY